MRGVTLGLLLLAGTGAAQGQKTERRTTMAPMPRGDELLRKTMLDAHNAARAAVGVTPLTWDDRLAADAASYASTLAREDRFEHAAQPEGFEREGENLWMGTRDAYALHEMVDDWIAERRFYRPAPTPDFSTTGNWSDVAHYTQIAWHSATAVGCALASNKSSDVLVCRYAPAGNVVGEMAF
ncbi:MAG: serine protease [Bradyrhizobium sp.]|nr:serine protease [Bradyrhizobium sp.]